MKRSRSPALLRRSLLILLLLILLPALFYTVFEITSLSESEEMMASIYRQQLEAVLFSLNQYAWDVANGWATSIAQVLGGAWTGSRAEIGEGLKRLGDRSPVLAGAFVADTMGSDLLFVAFPAPGGGSRQAAGSGRGPDPEAGRTAQSLPGSSRGTRAPEAVLQSAVLRVVKEQRGRVGRLVRYQKAEYRSIERVPIPGGTVNAVLLFVAADAHSGVRLAGVVVDEDRFLRNLMFPRIQAAAGDRFVLGVVDESNNRVHLSTEAVSAAGLHQRRRLWLFPDRSLGIRLKGETIEDVVRARLRQNIALLVVLDVVLLAGAWLVYRTLRRELEFARMKSDFVSTVSHELRTPLSLIRMYAETLEMERLSDPAKKKEYYATIVRETERLTRLVNNILSFSRIDAGRKEYRYGRVSLNDVVSEVLETFREHLRQAGFMPEISLQKDLPAVRADAEALGQAVINLLDNAVKYSDGATFLRITTGVDRGMVYVQVDDHGIGIAPAHHGKIFETFYRVLDGEVQNTRGSGLGLALVKHIIDAHGGSIVLESAPGKGSSFRLTFPRYAPTGEVPV